MSEFMEAGGYLRKAQRPKAKMIEPEVLLIHAKYFLVILFRRLSAKRLRIRPRAVEPINTPRVQIMESPMRAPRRNRERMVAAPKGSVYDKNFSKRSRFALQIGQTSGGCSRAQRYPQTLQRQMGKGRDFAPIAAGRAKAAFLSSGEGLRSGIEEGVFFPSMASFETYNAQ